MSFPDTCTSLLDQTIAVPVHLVIERDPTSPQEARCDSNKAETSEHTLAGGG